MCACALTWMETNQLKEPNHQIYCVVRSKHEIGFYYALWLANGKITSIACFRFGNTYSSEFMLIYLHCSGLFGFALFANLIPSFHSAIDCGFSFVMDHVTHMRVFFQQ